jgi:hypothetical membrane protein
LSSKTRVQSERKENGFGNVKNAGTRMEVDAMSRLFMIGYLIMCLIGVYKGRYDPFQTAVLLGLWGLMGIGIDIEDVAKSKK